MSREINLSHGQRPRILLLGASGYLGRCLYSTLFNQAWVLPVHRTRALQPGSLAYDFWRDDLQPLLREHRIDCVLMAVSVAAASVVYGATHSEVETQSYQEHVERFVRAASGRRLIYVSSDGIFDGNRGLYTEADIPTPMTPYGHNLQVFEQCVKQYCPDHCIVRPSYLYGYAGSQLDSRLARVRADLLANKTVHAFSDMYKSPMQVQQVATAIAHLALSDHQGIVHVAGPRMSVYHFYRAAMEALGVPHAQLLPAPIPTEAAVTRDTSLSINLIQQLTGIIPLTVKEALAGC